MIRKVFNYLVKILKKIAHKYCEMAQYNGYLLWSGYNIRQFELK